MMRIQKSKKRLKYRLPSNRIQLKLLKILINTDTTYKRSFIVNDEFYALFNLSKSQVIQILNALSAKELIDLVPPNRNCQFALVKIMPKAFSYIPDVQDNLFRFWLPIIISSCLSCIALLISIYGLLKQYL